MMGPKKGPLHDSHVKFSEDRSSDRDVGEEKRRRSLSQGAENRQLAGDLRSYAVPSKNRSRAFRSP